LNKSVGFFKELGFNASQKPSLMASISEEPHKDKEKIIKYLESGVLFMARGGFEMDVINPSDEIIGHGHIMTDGVWEWQDILAYYVRRYNVVLDEEFLRYMASKDWKVPKEHEIDLDGFE